MSKGLQGGALYYDCWTDDARLTVETAVAARDSGAALLNHVEVVGFEKDSSGRLSAVRVRDRLSGRGKTIRARAFVNVTGPWLDRVRRLDDPGAPPRLKVTKGVHAVFDRSRIGNRDAIVIRGVDDRVMFAIPWQQQTLIGTTDTYYEGDPAAVHADADDVDYILAAVDRAFPNAGIRKQDVISTYAGLRPLVAPDADASESDVSRDDQVFESPSGLISLGGGKLTTHRHVAETIVDRVAELIGHPVGPCRTASVPLPGAVGVEPGPVADQAPASAEDHMRARYGACAAQVQAAFADENGLARPLVGDLPDLKGEVVHAIDNEMAASLDDILSRRLQIALRSRERFGEVVGAVAELAAARLGWDDERTEAEISSFLENLRHDAAYEEGS